ncbi:MAG TPA: hypothetical protein VMU76_05690 [Acidimicrobiales bacterium]|nr:hypothetical protein [Acidimicrobiales bacterium]
MFFRRYELGCRSRFSYLVGDRTTSLLRASGFARVVDVLGGFGAWSAAGLPVAGDGTAEAGA